MTSALPRKQPVRENVLQPRAELGAAGVELEERGAARPEHPRYLREVTLDDRGVGDVLEDVLGEDEVERAVFERSQGGAARRLQVHVRGEAAGDRGVDHAGRDVDPFDLLEVVRERDRSATDPATDLEHAPATYAVADPRHRLLDHRATVGEELVVGPVAPGGLDRDERILLRASIPGAPHALRAGHRGRS